MQPHIEVLQAMILQHKFDEFTFNLCIAPKVDEIKKQLEVVFLTFDLKRLKEMDKLTPEDKRKALIIEHIRRHTQGVRNWGYYDQVINIVVKLFKPIDRDIKNSIGKNHLNIT